MAFPYPPDPGDDLRDLYRRVKQRDTVRDMGQISMKPGDGMLELRDGSGKLVGGYGDLPDGTFGFSIFRNGAVQNINTAFDADFHARDARLDQHDRNDASHQAQLDTADARLDQHDSDIQARPTHDVVGGWLQQRDVRMNGLDGQITRLDAVDASIASQLADRYTKSQIDSAFKSRDGRLDHLDAVDANIGSRLAGHDSSISSLSGRVSTAQSTANDAVSRANSAQGTANDALSRANGAQGSANHAENVANAALALAQNLRDRIDRGGIPM